MGGQMTGYEDAWNNPLSSVTLDDIQKALVADCPLKSTFFNAARHAENSSTWDSENVPEDEGVRADYHQSSDTSSMTFASVGGLCSWRDSDSEAPVVEVSTKSAGRKQRHGGCTTSVSEELTMSTDRTRFVDEAVEHPSWADDSEEVQAPYPDVQNCFCRLIAGGMWQRSKPRACFNLPSLWP